MQDLTCKTCSQNYIYCYFCMLPSRHSFQKYVNPSSEWGSHPLLQHLLPCCKHLSNALKNGSAGPEGHWPYSGVSICSSGVLKPKVCTFSLSIPGFPEFLTDLFTSALEWLLGVSKFLQRTAQHKHLCLWQTLDKEVPQVSLHLGMAMHPIRD